MSFTPQIEEGIPIPPQSRKGEDSEVVKQLLALDIEKKQSFTFPEFEADGTPTAIGKAYRYATNKLQKDGRARFSLRKLKDKPGITRVWRIAMPVKAVATEAATEVVEQTT
jgi:hypothetical protein